MTIWRLVRIPVIVMEMSVLLALAGCATHPPAQESDPIRARLPADARMDAPDTQRALIERGLYLTKEGRIRALSDHRQSQTSPATTSAPALPGPGEAPAEPRTDPVEIDLQPED